MPGDFWAFFYYCDRKACVEHTSTHRLCFESSLYRIRHDTYCQACVSLFSSVSIAVSMSRKKKRLSSSFNRKTLCWRRSSSSAYIRRFWAPLQNLSTGQAHRLTRLLPFVDAVAITRGFQLSQNEVVRLYHEFERVFLLQSGDGCSGWVLLQERRAVCRQ